MRAEATARRARMDKATLSKKLGCPVIWTPQAKQVAFMARGEHEALYGGAAGGGKSEALVMEALRQVHIPHYKALILRKTYPQLEELIGKSLGYYPRVYPRARYNDSKHTWTFPSGAKVIFGSMQHPKDKYNYQGQAYDFIAFDELTHFTFDEYIYLFSRNRPNGPGTRCYIRSTANPGGVGHGWVKERFITPAPPMTTVWDNVELTMPNGKTETRRRSRVFVPASVFDNPALLANDPNYLTNLAAMPDAERRALLYGDWDSYAGQVFSEWRNDPKHYADRLFTHVIDPFEPPKDWRYYRSFDWGYSKPFSCGWWAIDREGIAYRIAEFYGCKDGRPDVGREMNAAQVFDEIARMEREHPYLEGRQFDGVADPAIWDRQTGKSVAETAAERGIHFARGDNKRIAGWQQLHERLAFDDRGVPRMYIYSTCRDFIRTVPALEYDQNKAEDVDTRLEDHAADETRYFCMLNPVGRSTYNRAEGDTEWRERFFSGQSERESRALMTWE